MPADESEGLMDIQQDPTTDQVPAPAGSAADQPMEAEDEPRTSTMSPRPESAHQQDGNKAAEDDEVAKFDGKIVYNPDGSAYIIEDGNLSEEETLKLPRQEGSIIEKTGDETNASGANYPSIANAFYVSKSSDYFNALYGQAYVKMLQDKNVPETPVVHSYRVYAARDKDQVRRPEEPKQVPAVPIVVPVKPILMCFICKLSFACHKLFGSHCVDSHHLELTSDENEILNQKNTSAIILKVGTEQETQVSFLEPVSAPQKTPPVSPGAITNLLAAAAAAAKKPIDGEMGPPTTKMLQQFQQNLADGEVKLPMSSPANVRSVSPLEAVRSNSVSPAVTSPRVSSPAPSIGSNTSSFAATPQFVPTPTNANMLQGTTIGACPEHINGRPTGVECVKCDLIISSSRMAHGATWNLSRNSCKTLKCPKCNWHYKYQETLEIHMKEKHPESETTCIYCITGQQHPRLARGETYTCGYKPYRCEVCNYSTTTKGNLSIHMQSDKHLNNMQEIQHNGGPSASGSANAVEKQSAVPASRSGSAMSQSLPPTSMVSPMKDRPSSASQLPSSPPQSKPNWRCDVCSYETNVARNLRIHMTSEKHTHNMMAMQQQNAKNMSALQGLPSLPSLPGNQSLDPKHLLGMLSGALPPVSTAAGPEAAMADLAFNQAVLAQLMGGGAGLPKPPTGLPSPAAPTLPGGEFNFAAALAAAAGGAGLPGLPPLIPINGQDDSHEPPPEPTDQNPKCIYTCCVCRVYSCDNLDDLSNHLSEDRSHTRENEVSMVIAGNYLCQLCNYKTNLKANFQLHCKTDKHLQRLSHVNHIKEGGPANEWKLRFITSINPVELRCNACEFYSNSPHKLQVHVSGQQHQVSALLFSHLQNMEASFSDQADLSYICALCKFSAKGKHGLLAHVRTMQHLQMEQIHQLQKRAEGNVGHTEIGDIFQVLSENGDDVKTSKREGAGYILVE